MAPPQNSATSPTSPKSPTIQGFDNLNLKSLAQSTKKAFERLAPYTKIQNPARPDSSGPVVDQLVAKFTERVQTLVEGIDESIGAVEVLYHISKEAGNLCDTVPLPLETDEPKTKKSSSSTPAIGNDNEKVAAKPMSRVGSMHSLLQLRASHSKENPQQKSRERLDELANNACEKALKAVNAFKQVDQELYKIHAATKDMPPESTVQIPVDPTAPKLITKSIRDLGSDLVSNLNLLSTFSGHLNDLNDWCEWVKNGVASGDFEGGSALLPSDIDTPARRKQLDSQWTKILTDTVLYHNMLSDMLARYITLLPHSAESWQVVMEQRENEKRGTKKEGKKGVIGRVVNVLLEATRYLGCHVCCCC